MSFLKRISQVLISIFVLGGLYIFIVSPELGNRVKFLIASTGLTKSPKIQNLIPDKDNLALYVASEGIKQKSLLELINSIKKVAPLIGERFQKEFKYLNKINLISEGNLDTSKAQENIDQYNSQINQVNNIELHNKFNNSAFSFGVLINKELNISLANLPGEELLDSISIFTTFSFPTDLPLIGMMLSVDLTKQELFKQFDTIIASTVSSEEKQRLFQLKKILLGSTFERNWSKGYPVLKINNSELGNIDLFLGVIGQDTFIVSSNLEVLTDIFDKSYGKKTNPFIKQVNDFAKNKFISLSLNVNAVLDKSPQLAMMGRMFIKSLNSLSFDFSLNERFESSLVAYFDKKDDTSFFSPQIKSVLQEKIKENPSLKIVDPQIIKVDNQIIIESGIELEKLITEFTILLNNENLKFDKKINTLNEILKLKKEQNLSVYRLENSKLNEGKGFIKNKSMFLPFSLSIPKDDKFIPKFLFIYGHCSTLNHRIDLLHHGKKIKFFNLNKSSDAKLNTKEDDFKIYQVFNNKQVSKLDLKFLGLNEMDMANCSLKDSPFLLVKKRAL